MSKVLNGLAFTIQMVGITILVLGLFMTVRHVYDVQANGASTSMEIFAETWQSFLPDTIDKVQSTLENVGASGFWELLTTWPTAYVFFGVGIILLFMGAALEHGFNRPRAPQLLSGR